MLMLKTLIYDRRTYDKINNMDQTRISGIERCYKGGIATCQV